MADKTDQTYKNIAGYVQNVSPIQKGPKKNFFDFQLQTESETCVRAICFSPPKRKLFQECEKNSIPVKIKRFMDDKKPESTDILMGDYIVVEQLEAKDISFTKKLLLPADFNLSMLSSMSPGQIINVRAILMQLNEVETVNMPQGKLRKVYGLLVDPYGSAKVTFWENEIEKVKAGETYEFENLRLKKNRYNGELYVNPAKAMGSISKSEPFEEDLFIPEYDPTELTTCSITGEIFGVFDVRVDYCCARCNSSVKEEETTRCKTCNIALKLTKCKKQWYVKALAIQDDVEAFLVFRHESVLKVLLLSDAEGDPLQLLKAFVTEKFLSLQPCKFTYKNKTKVVQSVDLA